MTLQVLVSTMHQNDYSLLARMNIQTDAIVINQCNKNETNEFIYNGHIIKWISTTDRGVGRSRNLAIINSTADIILFADDDVCYVDGYEDIVINEFKHQNWGLIVFNLTSLNPRRPEIIIKKGYRLKWFNCLKFGACKIAVDRKMLLYKNIFFSLLFGGGATYQAGEDNLFITNCIQSKMKCYASSSNIGSVKQEESTWFKGYNEKYYIDRGALFFAMYGKKSSLILFFMELKKTKNTSYTLIERYRFGKQGIDQYKNINR